MPIRIMECLKKSLKVWKRFEHCFNRLQTFQTFLSFANVSNLVYTFSGNVYKNVSTFKRLNIAFRFQPNVSNIFKHLQTFQTFFKFGGNVEKMFKRLHV